jgi:hypothetical protein
MFRREKGVVLVVVITVAVIFAIIGFATLSVAEQEINLTRIEADRIKAFYYAESGLAKLSEILQYPAAGNLNEALAGVVGQGGFRVTLDANQSSCYAVSTGTSGTIQKSISVKVNFLAPPFENAIFAMNGSGGNYAFKLRGTGNPVAGGFGTESGGKDKINGNIYVDGDVFMYEESSINPAPAPNRWNYNGDVKATGNVSVASTSSISGSVSKYVDEAAPIDLISMDYAHNNTHNVAKVFSDAGVTKGYLPKGNELRDIFLINPASMKSECDSTAGNDYFLEPSSGGVAGGSPKESKTPLHMGNDRIYYVDGDIWVHNKTTYGFNVMDGKVTIVATGDIHICDNLAYADSNSMLGLIALGKYNSSGQLTSGGNIFFGDPQYGTMYTVSAMMFAAHDFLFNTNAISRQTAEPTTGFTINGNFGAMNQVSINRDWYTKGGTSAQARYDTATNKWVDAGTGTQLTSTEVGTLRHYQMIINYDDRVRDQATQPPGLPRGGGSKIFDGFSKWKEL